MPIPHLLLFQGDLSHTTSQTKYSNLPLQLLRTRLGSGNSDLFRAECGIRRIYGKLKSSHTFSNLGIL